MHIEHFLHLNGKAVEEAEYVQLEGCLDQLPELQQKCIKYHYYEKKSYKEIAIILDQKQDKIRSYIQNGRRNLKNCMNKKREEFS